MDILDMILGAEMANEYTDSQRLAREEKTVITWDGNTDGKHSLNGMLFKVSDIPITVTNENIKSVILSIEGEGHSYQQHFNISDLTVIIDPEGAGYDAIVDDSGVIIMIAHQNVRTDEVVAEKGVYLYYVEDNGYGGKQWISLVELETVHQIDQKFIPGVTLPVINYEDYFNIDFISAIMAGAMAGTEKPFFISDLVKSEFAKKFTPETPVAVVKIDVTQEDITADIYCFARACFANGSPTLIRINDSFYYNDSIVNFDIYALASGAGFTQHKAQDVTYPG